MHAATLPSAQPFNRPSTGRINAAIRRLAEPTLWLTVKPDAASGVHNFTPELIAEFRRTLDEISFDSATARVPHEFPRYAIVHSGDPNYFSQGGDLSFFLSCILKGDAEGLRRYSSSCLDVLLSWSSDFKSEMHTISLVQGRALGGGFEMALSSDHIIAEEQSTFGFPEIMFGLFPCTGAMGLVSARTNPHVAERLMTDKKVYTAAQLLDMGLIDQVCPTGQGELAVEQYIGTHAKRRKARMKVQQSRHRMSKIDPEEGLLVVDDWVETAMSLSPDEIRQLEMLILMQHGERPAEPSLKVA
ncbi:enoyl-CoA hydratase/isomerase family protein [Luteimonas sp. SJ-92]|uniref:Enoyl-CoA hydratase/isomerase family protein n=1 Tax=Luteimonas salinisoli TaxID=2752307 RepID=A0A853JG95_9GAMM|nr:crotonase/enoyl-CoA hydratase family protein [Luteimonas salinisoli]NZA27619.1 enoyl-CoA hydratase/isomerase family protein [Luteimonas salinisoli]